MFLSSQQLNAIRIAQHNCYADRITGIHEQFVGSVKGHSCLWPAHFSNLYLHFDLFMGTWFTDEILTQLKN